MIDIISRNEHNTPRGLEEIRKLRIKMNKYIMENNSNGSSKYS